MKGQTNRARHHLYLILALGSLITAATLVLGPASRASAQAVTPSWSYTGNLNTARSLHTATLLQNGKVLVAGGNDPLVGDSVIIISINSAELYDPATGTWSGTGTLNAGHAFHTATLLQNGKVLIAGGLECFSYFQPCFPHTSAELYDPATGTWSVTGSLNTARYAFTATLLPNGKVLVVGDGFSRHDAELYDPSTGTWSYTGSLNTATSRFDHGATLLPDGKVLVTGGGYCGNDGCFRLSSSELYDPATEMWSATGDLITGRSRHKTTLLPNGKVLATAGGYYTADNQGFYSIFRALNTAELYDPATGAWSNTGDLNVGRSNHSAMLLPNHRVLVAGGDHNNGDSSELYDPTAQTWTNTASLNTPRYEPIGTLLSNGKVLAAGGSYDNSAELYHPAITPGSNTVQFSGASHNVSETGRSVQPTVNRTDTSGAASVDYATSDTAALSECNVVNSIASSRCDYATSVGTLRFAAGEASKNIFIPIVNDGYAEGNETFSITLSNPVGATLGSFSTANITIQDNETVNGANPLDQVDFFIEQHYIDFLGRNPEPAGLEGWRNVLNNCGVTVQPPCDPIEVSAGFFRSPEFQARGYFIYRFFSAVGRIPLHHEFMPDFAQVSGFLSDAQLEANKAAFVNEFMARAEFQTKYSSTFGNPTAYVDALLQTVGLPGHPTRTTWINQLDANNTSQTRGEVLRALVESQQVYDKYYNEAFVIMQYFGYLRRTADAAYLDWIQTMNQTGGDYRIMINGFMNSAEYRGRFGP